MPTGVRYDYELVHSVFPHWRRTRKCDKCHMLCKEVAEDCWVSCGADAASCRAGGLHVCTESLDMDAISTFEWLKAFA